MQIFVCIAIVVSFLFSVVCGHPTHYKDVQLKTLAPGELPLFRSYHVHFLFEKTRSSDDCTGYDDAIRLRNKFIKDFNVSPYECQGTFDQGQMCAFSVSLGPFGPFIQPEFAFFVPFNQFQAVVTWTQLHHQQFSALIHPNSGYEREDHSTWALWAGTPKYLDLTIPEFSEQLSPYFNTSCRDEPAYYPFPGPYPTLSPTAAHVRLVSLLPDTATTITVSYRGVPGAFPAVTHLDQTGYYDFAPTGSATFCADFTTAPAPPSTTCLIQATNPGVFYTLVAWNKQLFYFNDAYNTPDNEVLVRILNFVSDNTIISARRDGQTIVQQLKAGAQSTYDQPQGNAQHFYEIIDSSTGAAIQSIPYYTTNGEAVTIIAVGGVPSLENPNASTVLLYDGA